MGFYDQSGNDEGQTSKFNEAFHKMGRLNKLQDSINLCSMNPTARNEMLQVYNYMIIITACDGLLKECWGKLTEEERKDAVALKEAISTTLKQNPVHYPAKDASGKIDMRFNEKNWLVFKDWIFKYDVKIRELLSRAGYDSPNFEDDFDGL